MAETVIHEFGHYFGMSEEEIEEIEEKYWRGEPSTTCNLVDTRRVTG